jgi:hypothetical protein
MTQPTSEPIDATVDAVRQLAQAHVDLSADRPLLRPAPNSVGFGLS